MEIKAKQDTVPQGRVLDLGRYGHAEEVPTQEAWPEPATFPWFGVQVRVSPTLNDTALIDLLEESGGLDDKDPKAAVAVKKFIREVIHADDFNDFWKLGKANGYSTKDFAEVAGRILTAVTGDPTQESSDSSTGASSTAQSSPVGSSKRIIEDLEAEGRPELAEFFVLAREAGVAR